jgi:putative CocE/NonD family hydrolase
MIPQESIRLDINVPAKMRDGTILYADVIRPNSDGKYPAILIRLPYNKEVMFGGIFAGYTNPRRVAQAGYGVVIQDCRGTGMSEGKFYPLRSDPEDGYDTVEWLAKQPWCDGNVGMFGASYLGYTQWAAAVTQPPHLKAICPAQHPVVGRGEPPVKNGLFNIKANMGWYLGFCANELRRSKLPLKRKQSLQKRILEIMDSMNEQCLLLPLKDVPATEIGNEVGMEPCYSDWLDHFEDAGYWAKLTSPAPLEKVVIPALHLSGWYDILVSGVLANYEAIQKKASSEFVRKNQKLLIGPWTHGGNLLNIIGELNFGAAAAGAMSVCEMHIRWFDYWLKGINNGIMDEPPVRIFIMGDNIWRNENEWPLARTKYTEYYLHSNGQANTRFGDGILNAIPPDKEETDMYLYDPKHPVQSTAEGTALCDQYEIEKRSDVLVYTTAPLDRDIEVTGPIKIKLWAASSAVDTDFTGKLVDVWPNGKAYNLTEGTIRARYRNTTLKTQLIEPDKVYEYSIDLGATSNVFKSGHRIRIQISSSNFPKHDRNLNTGHPIGQDAEMKVAVQTIYHDKQYPSHILLPIIPR